MFNSIVTVEQAADLLRPHRTKAIRLERVWPPHQKTSLLSQIGGSPNFPPGWSWPKIDFPDSTSASLDFLAQINLEELPDMEDRDLLPREGMLYFFALSLSHQPLQTFGSDAWRVLYYPHAPDGLPVRDAPDDAGWAKDYMYYSRMPGWEYREPGASPASLFPKCPIRFVIAELWAEPEFAGPDDPALGPFAAALLSQQMVWEPEPLGLTGRIMNLAKRFGRPGNLKLPAASTRRNSVDLREMKMKMLVRDCLTLVMRDEDRGGYDQDKVLEDISLPYRADDAILLLNAVRNDWLEDVMPIKTVLNNEGKYSDDLLLRYEAWRAEAVDLTETLVAIGRQTKLSDEQRERVNDVLKQHGQLRKEATSCGLIPYNHLALRASLQPLMTAFPDITNEETELLASYDPARDPLLNGPAAHLMLSKVGGIQSDLDPDEVLLLQLASDCDGPRWKWWDLGVLRFSIKKDALAAMRFDLAQAEIEGH
ncbi:MULTISPECIES: DUF1963 domain-containing protein [Rhizobium/Agrobacterium group]|uniref:DUF1963 domain-containing protein n=1 Tax=Rhizobium/Agrobacterium group TaxID=227290 RepID=UPI002301EE4B|nr:MULTISPECIES: DUF1963 domain-containing protein [Rhizobium/Agrobacterium group]MDA5635910.1 DUF1963 domain-containing protein [Agrobacterium sp. ST15.16.024]MDF1891181.1 DUF1963 domain-containing protein [Rhizobium rhizogenes]